VRQVIQNFKSGELSIQDVPAPALQPGGIIVANRYSVISAGTERLTVATAQKNIVGKAQSRPDLVDKVKQSIKRDGLLHTIDVVRNKLDAPIALGYSSAGKVLAVADDVEGIKVGDSVACAGQGYASHAEQIFVPKNLAVKVPKDVGLDEAAFATLGAIAMQGVRQADITVGETVAVIGLGLLGLLTVQILKAAGCIVVGMDIRESSCDSAISMGADHATISDRDLVHISESITMGLGIDKVIITASTNDNAPIVNAGEILKRKGVVVLVGLVPANLPRSPFYEKEIDFRYSCSYGPGRYDPLYEEKGFDYPFSYVRWTEQRNMHSFLQLVSQKKIQIRPFITHTFLIDQAEEAYDLVTGKNKIKTYFQGILFEYSENKTTDAKDQIVINDIDQSNVSSHDKVHVGFIGAGNFAQRFLIPAVKNVKNVKLQYVSTTRGITSQGAAKKFGFTVATTNNDAVLNDPDVHAVFIATRHHLHAKLVSDCLKKNKAVYVEKPLAILQDELDSLVQEYNAQPGHVMTGFNRRFSPHVEWIISSFSPNSPKMIHYRVNAGFIPKDHWTQDLEQGGGRIIGEVCHFIDLINFFTKSYPIKLYAESMDSYTGLNDSVSIILKYSNGSVGTITYSAVGDKALPKERIEILAKDYVAILDDFRKSNVIKKGKTTQFKTGKQDKGHNQSVASFLQSISDGAASTISFQDACNATKLTLLVQESLAKGDVITFHPYE